MKNRNKLVPETEEYAAFQEKIMRRFVLNIFISIAIVMLLYLFLWKGRFGNWTVWLLQTVLKLEHEEAFWIYHSYFRGNRELFFAVVMLAVFMLLLGHLFRWLTRYFKEINQGIDALLTEAAGQIYLSPEMQPFERKLNAVKKELERQRAEAASAEQRKDELVMYLAHDIRTPLTSVIGYLNLLEEEPDMPAAQRARHVHLTLEKACRLEEMINEFFEITRFNSRQIKVSKIQIDLYYMMIQLCDELSPVFAPHGNQVKLDMDENLSICADPDKIARVFSNILKNAAAYSYPGTEISISAEEQNRCSIIVFRNHGQTIPAGKISQLFDKFYRLESARVSDTGGTGLGLAIAKEIVSLHGGDIEAASENETITFTISLPLGGENICP